MKNTIPSLLVGLLLALGTLASHAQIISVNFVGGNAGGLGSLTSGQVAGATPAANWNNFSGGSGTPGAALNNSTGTATGVTLNSFTSQAVWDLGSGGVNTPDKQLLYSYIVSGPGQTITISLSGISFSSYNLIVYIQGATNDAARVTTNQAGSPSFYVKETASLALTQVTSTDSANPGIGTYTVFTGLTNSSLNFTATSVPRAVGDGGGYGYVGVTGFQIVAVPEPSTWALLAGGCAALIGVVRRRKH